MGLIVRWIVFSLAIYGTTYVLSEGVHINGGFGTILFLALVLGLINAIIKPIVSILTLPINIITLGLLSFVINALMVLLAGQVVAGFSVDGFWWALAFSLVVSVINSIISNLLGNNKSK